MEVSKQVEGRGEHDMAIEIARDAKEAGAYPLVLVSYHVVYTSTTPRRPPSLVEAFGAPTSSPRRARRRLRTPPAPPRCPSPCASRPRPPWTPFSAKGS
ncbi:hypothetical protein QJS66_09880 [Kocuria rhizophila]|nr:hypothetical protein QJS66_09880 [Kocuria rhizophila]